MNANITEAGKRMWTCINVHALKSEVCTDGHQVLCKSAPIDPRGSAYEATPGAILYLVVVP